MSNSFIEGAERQSDMLKKDRRLYEPLDSIGAESREFLTNYIGIPADELLGHLRRKNIGWEQDPWTCIGINGFYRTYINDLPSYPEILSRLKRGQNLLDIGCCFAQDIRRLVYDGVPSENLRGADLHEEFIDLGYDLFRDRRTLKAEFVVGDVLKEYEYKRFDSKIDVVLANLFFHVWNWKDQQRVGERIVKFTQPRKGSVIVGRQLGSINPKEVTAPPRGSKVFLHNAETLRKLWDDIGVATDTLWKVDFSFMSVDFAKQLQGSDSDFQMFHFRIERQ
ncbi:hypothetical protein LTR66_007374 [Elasticomyces elasticus]|nr:hypothetical protein LTR66_007374 [Elasticomyces elasticus]